jgi:phosphoribosylformylglycinamidine synthase
MAVITPEVYSSMGLNDFEYERIVSLLGREPSITELGMFSVMWSEHCGYKYSRPVLALFKKYKEAMEGEGHENAGVVDIGDGWGVTMKVESHNHPSAVEPYQGAATGVGGIIRDILTMGARPIAALNSLRFGPIVPDGTTPDAVVRRNRYLFEHVVAGIAGYGNCVGVPTIGGEVNFHPRYSGNPLVNAMCVGMLRLDEITTAAAQGDGNPVIYIGSATGKDGIHGASFASKKLKDDAVEDRPNVQIGDPFAEKLLIEGTLEALKTGAIVAIQDMGAAGLTCSTVEMSSKGGVGMEIDLDKVPMRESDMSAYELMLSESQERMLAVAEKGREQEVLDVFRKWGLKAEVIGYVNEQGETTVRRNGEVAASLDATFLTDHCPTYVPPFEVPEYHLAAQRFMLDRIPDADSHQSLLSLLAAPNIASKRWVYQQYDQQVQTQTVVLPGHGDAAVVAPRGTSKGLALTIDGNARHVYLHPYVGGLRAVCEAARNVACVGARPVAVTDGLNYGNPQRPHVYWQFKESVLGIAEACEMMDTPVISGNVSFYNESDLGEVLPTPLIGMLGVLERADRAVGHRVYGGLQLGVIEVPLPTDPQSGLGGSEYLAAVHGIEDGLPTAPDIQGERRLCQALVQMIERGVIAGAHDIADGGVAVALAEIAISSGVGIVAKLPAEGRRDVALFSEAPGRVIVAFDREVGDEIAEFVRDAELRWWELGATVASSDVLEIDGVRWPLSELVDAFEGSIPRAMA